MGFAKKSVLILGWVLIFSLLAYGIYGGLKMTQTLWPGLHDDACLYSTVAINRASGFGNQFHVYARSLILGKGSTEFTAHGQLYYPVAAALLSTPDYEGFLGFIHWSNLAAYLLAFVVFSWQSQRSLQAGWLASSMIGVAGAYATVAVLHYLQGRPEHGIPFVQLACVLIVLLLNCPAIPSWLAGLQIGLVGAISPLPGVLLAVAMIFHTAISSMGWFEFIRKSIIQAISAFSSWALIYMLILDIDMIPWFKSTFGASEVYVPKLFPEKIIAYWFKLNFIPCAAFIFFLASWVGFWLFLRSIKNSILCAFGAAVCAGFLAYLAWKFAVGSPATHYCAVVFLPAISIWCIQNLRKCDSPQLFSRHVPAMVYAMSIFVCLAFPSMGFARNIFLQNWLSHNEWNYQQTHMRIEELKSTLGPNEKIAIDAYTNTRSSVIFDGPPWKCLSLLSEEKIPDVENKLNIRVQYFLVTQFSHLQPPEKDGFRIVENTFNQIPVKVLGISIKTSLPGFGYALYKRDEDVVALPKGEK